MSLPIAGLPLANHGALVERLEDWGFTDVWSQETDGHDAFAPLAFAAAHAPTLRLGTAIASVSTRGPALLAQQAAALADAAPGRFVLGLGVSSAPIVAGWNGLPFDRPLARMRAALAFLRVALAGERVDARFETFASRGFRLERPPAVPPPIQIAALGPRMLDLALRETDGVLLSLVAPEDVPALIGTPRPAAGFEVVLRIGAVVDRDPAVALAHCKRLIAGYLSVERYAALHRGLGRGPLLEPMWRAWASGDRAAALAAIPDALVDALFVYGDARACREGIARFRAAGVTTPIVSIMRWQGALASHLAELGSA